MTGPSPEPEPPPAPTSVPAGARRVSVAGRRLERWIEGFCTRHGAFTAAAEPELVRLDAVDGSQAWLDVPFPPLPLPLLDGSDPVQALIEHSNRDRRVGVLLVRRGGYAAGIFQGDRLVASKVGTSYVQGTTKAGGWSQHRFARRRDNQARVAFDRAADLAAGLLVPVVGELDALVCGGDRVAVDLVLADPRLADLRELRAGPVLSAGDPRRRVLDATAAQFLAVRIALWP